MASHIVWHVLLSLTLLLVEAERINLYILLGDQDDDSCSTLTTFTVLFDNCIKYCVGLAI